MEINEPTIKSLKDLDKLKNEMAWIRMAGKYDPIYRGQPSDKYKLIHGLSRKVKDIDNLKIIEEDIIRDFYNELKTKKLDNKIQENLFGDKYSNEKEWGKLFQAQHLGLPTRLLDWTISLEAALYFAIGDQNHVNENGMLFIYYVPKDIFYTADNMGDYLNYSPYKINELLFINHPFSIDNRRKEFTGENRREKQFGRFSIEPIEKSIIPLEKENPNVTKHLIPKEYKKELKRCLNDQKITDSKLLVRSEEIIAEIITNLKHKYEL